MRSTPGLTSSSRGWGTLTSVLADITNEHGKENGVKIIKQFQPGLSKMAPTKKGGEDKKGCSAINKVVTREYTINVHRYIMGWASRRVPLRHSKRLGNCLERGGKSRCAH